MRRHRGIPHGSRERTLMASPWVTKPGSKLRTAKPERHSAGLGGFPPAGHVYPFHGGSPGMHEALDL